MGSLNGPSMLSAVNPRSNGFGGGLYQPAGRPTGVAGAPAPPGTAAPSPASVPSSGVIEARNNSGSNVRVPYARCGCPRTHLAS